MGRKDLCTSSNLQLFLSTQLIISTAQSDLDQKEVVAQPHIETPFIQLLAINSAFGFISQLYITTYGDTEFSSNIYWITDELSTMDHNGKSRLGFL